MKKSKYAAILVASLAVGLSTHASAVVPIPGQSVLAGFYAFDSTAGPELADESNGITAIVAKAAASQSTLGSTDTYYGQDWPVPTGGASNGRLNLVAGTPTVFSILNSTGLVLPIEYLFFDVGRDPAFNPAVTVFYSISNGASNVPLTIPALTPYSTSNDYTDFNLDLPGALGIQVPVGESIDFAFFTTAAAKLDNVLFTTATPIPEPGSLVALGCFLGSGLLIRRNRRTIA